MLVSNVMNLHTLYFIFTFLLAVFIFLTFTSAFNPFSIFKKQSPTITGDVIAVKDNTQIQNSAKCIDSDGGVFSEIAGNVSIRKAMQWGLGDRRYNVYYDYCIRNTTLIEYYCDKNIVKSARFVCKEGCERGECKFSSCIIGKGMKILNGNYSKKITFVFVPDNYTDQSLWEKDVNNFTNYLLSLEPFKSYKNRFDIWRIDELNRAYLSGGYRSGTDLYDNERDIIVNISRKCIGKPEDLLIIIKDNSLDPTNTFGFADTNGFSDKSKPLFVAVRRLQGSIPYLGENELAHEVGHGFGDLSEEYDGSAVGSYSYQPNIDDEGCKKWCAGYLNSSSPCYNQYVSYMKCASNITKNFTISISYPDVLQCNNLYLYHPYELEYCDMGVKCKNNTGCYWHTASIQAFRSSLNSVMRYGTQFDGINFEIIKKRIENLTA